MSVYLLLVMTDGLLVVESAYANLSQAQKAADTYDCYTAIQVVRLNDFVSLHSTGEQS